MSSFLQFVKGYSFLYMQFMGKLVSSGFGEVSLRAFGVVTSREFGMVCSREFGIVCTSGLVVSSSAC